MIKLGCIKYSGSYVLSLIIGVVVSKNQNEFRVPLVPQHVKNLIKVGFSVVVESQCGKSSDYSDEQYQEVGAKVVKKRTEVFQKSDVILCLGQPDDLDVKASKNKTSFIGLLNPYGNKEHLEKIVSLGHSCYSLELLPRITRAQNMDVLSSQSNLMGYCSVIHAANIFKGIFSMMVTAAGTIKPARVLVIGAGVAGLQAIATAKRLGAIVHAFDVRPEAKEQVESLGGIFVSVDENGTSADKQVYAKEVTAQYRQKQQLALENILKTQDIVITTALIPGKPAPKILTKAMVELMSVGSVVVDLAGASGGNCELTQWGKDVEHQNVIISSPYNILNNVAKTASFTLSNNFTNFLTTSFKNGWDGTATDLDFEILNAVRIAGEILDGSEKKIQNFEDIKVLKPKVVQHKKSTSTKPATTGKKEANNKKNAKVVKNPEVKKNVKKAKQDDKK
ncbi:MAG: NAD(P)(+) transhydrogenase (Re/Si-specific) subunit alpha [Candidatus Puniceispirillum sp.]|nr:NAD(P)(+) transhydrogenase (Re/Si-specific) subunit alpha [Candidatus Pelagibacter sp.]MBA4283591.1 NAD(P)(+) transhydrogenase (Re/Si-specific) subunit alpha [Candidatus Puniceispirillum sp.]